MKIREGAYYRTRGGQVFGPMVKAEKPTTKYIWCLSHVMDGTLWDEEGVWRRGWSGPFDLISEVYVSDTPPADALPSDGVTTFENCSVGTYTPAPETKTLRDEFAGLALIGLLAAGSMWSNEAVAEAWRKADAMMEARKK